MDSEEEEFIDLTVAQPVVVPARRNIPVDVKPQLIDLDDDSPVDGGGALALEDKGKGKVPAQDGADVVMIDIEDEEEESPPRMHSLLLSANGKRPFEHPKSELKPMVDVKSDFGLAAKRARRDRETPMRMQRPRLFAPFGRDLDVNIFGAVADDDAPGGSEKGREQAQLLAGADPDDLDPIVVEGMLEGLAHETIKPAEPHTDLRAELYPYQKIGLAWLLKMERGWGTLPRGGIIADEQGLGKTVQMIALILSERPERSPSTPRNTRQPFRTLVVAPLALLRQWESEINNHSRVALNIVIYHGTDRERDPAYLATSDIVITTYHTLAQETPRAEERDADNRLLKARVPPGPIFKVKWFRIILDEATAIKNPLSSASKSVAKLVAERRWCLSGTPIQNRLEELFPLFRFIRYHPYDDPVTFKELAPKTRGGEDLENLQRLRSALAAVCIRRLALTQMDGKPILVLPRCVIEYKRVPLSEEELDFYRAIEEQTQVQFSRFLKAGTVIRNYMNILQLLLLLRQACCHPMLVKEAAAKAALQAIEPFEKEKNNPPPADGLPEAAAALTEDARNRLKEGNVDSECPICLDVPDDAEGLITKCGHTFCRTCLYAAIGLDDAQPLSRGLCPSCRREITPRDCLKKTLLLPPPPPPPAPADKEGSDDKGKGPAVDDEGDEDDAELLRTNPLGAIRRLRTRFSRTHMTSTKILQLMEVLDTSLAIEPPTKVLVFSQWTSMLDLVEAPLQRHGIRYLRYDGSMSADAREAVIAEFKTSKTHRVLLCSLKCAGMGLNLTVASRVVLMDPWWNPFLHEQALKRVHRIGQTRDVHVTHITIADTVEDRILALQDYKRNLANAALGDGAAEDSRLTLQQLVRLFGLDLLYNRRPQNKGLVIDADARDNAPDPEVGAVGADGRAH